MERRSCRVSPTQANVPRMGGSSVTNEIPLSENEQRTRVQRTPITTRGPRRAAKLLVIFPQISNRNNFRISAELLVIAVADVHLEIQVLQQCNARVYLDRNVLL